MPLFLDVASAFSKRALRELARGAIRYPCLGFPRYTLFRVLCFHDASQDNMPT